MHRFWRWVAQRRVDEPAPDALTNDHAVREELERPVAEERYDLAVGVDAYTRLYETVLAGRR